MPRHPKSNADDLTANELFCSEEACRAWLERVRWPHGVRCPRCDASKGISRISTRGQFDCDACGYQFSVRSGTVFHDSRLPLRKWLLAVCLVSQSAGAVPPSQLERLVGVSHKTAWSLRRRIRAAMTNGQSELLAGIVRAMDPPAEPAGSRGRPC
jgi:transposase-like protein